MPPQKNHKPHLAHHLETAGNQHGKGGRWADPQSLLFLTARYLEHTRARNYSHRTVYRFERHLAYFRKYCEALGLTQARQVTRAVILSYQSYLFHYKKADGSPLSAATQQHWLVCLVRFFSYLTREGLVLYNPASDIDLPRREHRLPRALLSSEDVETILSSIDVTDPMGVRDRAIIETLYSTGIRRMELCNLDIAHVDLGGGGEAGKEGGRGFAREGGGVVGAEAAAEGGNVNAGGEVGIGVPRHGHGRGWRRLLRLSGSERHGCFYDGVRSE